MARKTKTKRQLILAEALTHVKRLRDVKKIYDPKLLAIGARVVLIKYKNELNLDITLCDSLVGAVMSMLAREDKAKRSIADFGMDNLLSMYELEDMCMKNNRKAQYEESVKPDDLKMPDLADIEYARSILIKRSENVSSEIADSEEPDFAAILESRATEDAKANETIEDALVGFEELDNKE